MAKHRHRRCKNSESTIAKSLQKHYRDEHLFTLKQSLESYDIYQQKNSECDYVIENKLAQFDDEIDIKENSLPPRQIKKPKKGRNEFTFDLRSELYRMTGVDLTKIDGIDSHTGLKIISVIGLDIGRWKTYTHFSSWLGLCPGSKISGGKLLSGKTKPNSNRAAAALRLAAQGLHSSNSALNAYFRRQKTRLGTPKAITATAHKLARIIYTMLKTGSEYVDPGLDYYERHHKKKS